MAGDEGSGLRARRPCLSRPIHRGDDQSSGHALLWAAKLRTWSPRMASHDVPEPAGWVCTFEARAGEGASILRVCRSSYGLRGAARGGAGRRLRMEGPPRGRAGVEHAGWVLPRRLGSTGVEGAGDDVVLIVDDDPSVRELGELFLQEGYGVQTAVNGLAALETVRSVVRTRSCLTS